MGSTRRIYRRVPPKRPSRRDERTQSPCQQRHHLSVSQAQPCLGQQQSNKSCNEISSCPPPPSPIISVILYCPHLLSSSSFVPALFLLLFPLLSQPVLIFPPSPLALFFPSFGTVASKICGRGVPFPAPPPREFPASPPEVVASSRYCSAHTFLAHFFPSSKLAINCSALEILVDPAAPLPRWPAGRAGSVGLQQHDGAWHYLPRSGHSAAAYWPRGTFLPSSILPRHHRLPPVWSSMWVWRAGPVPPDRASYIYLKEVSGVKKNAAVFFRILTSDSFNVVEKYLPKLSDTVEPWWWHSSTPSSLGGRRYCRRHHLGRHHKRDVLPPEPAGAL